MNNKIDRKTFFKHGLLKILEPFSDVLEGLADLSRAEGLRPPGAVDEAEFLRLCTKCDECIIACPQSSIRRAIETDDLPVGTPILHPAEGPCYLCEPLHCAMACPEGALVPVEQKEVRMGVAEVDRDKCFAWKQEDPSCDYCYTRCPLPDEAIKMVKGGGPIVLDSACVGCGLCEYYCVPGDKAITITPERSYGKR